jgi:hypothetical protein
MIADRLKEIRRAYRREMDDVEAILTNALCDAYKEITGKKASLKLEESIAEAIRYEDL